MNIGIDTSDFVSLIGAFDFINNLILAISQKAEESNDKIFVLLKKDSKEYKNFKGIKRIIKKLECVISNNFPKYKISDSHGDFGSYNCVEFVEYNSNLNIVARQLKLSCIFLVTNFSQTLPSIPIIGYLYDCQHKYYPQFFSKCEIIDRDKHFFEMVKHPCVVNSIDTKKDLIKFYKANEKFVYSLPFTPKLKKDYLIEKKDIISKYNLPKRYFLSSNQFWIHKDHPTLFKAFKNITQQQEFKDVELICTGTMEEYRKADYLTSLKDLIKNLNIEKQVRFLGRIPKNEQIEIMKNCEAVVQTTLFEGGPGGGSVWDACALGIRSIVSDIPVNLEIKNDLVTFFEKQNVNDLTKKMIMILNSTKIKYSHQELIDNSNKNIKILGERLYEIIEDVKCNMNKEFYEQK